jgi:lysophospholipase L1-like esterase
MHIKPIITSLLFTAFFINTATMAQTDSAKISKKVEQKNTEDYRLRNDWANLQRFEAENAQLGTPKASENRIVFMGNSITQGWGDKNPEFFAGKSYVNRGIGGQTTPQMLLRFRPDVINLKPKVVVILAGTNDIAGNTGPTSEETIVGNLISMAQLAQVNGIKVVISSIIPVYDYPWKRGLNPADKIAAINKRLKSYAQSNGMIYLDYYAAMVDERKGLKDALTYDGVHPNKDGYLVMGPLAEKAIQAALKLKK